MTTVYKQLLQRDISPADVEKYLAGGWTTKSGPTADTATEVINLKPAAIVKAAAKPATDNANEPQGE
jgi:hypothetical protein